ncbi:EF-hand domain-containing protein [Flagellimonas sp.]|uniref:EF-hand domain-containing protein n=1 Tax=Flagellimonas sp. TaxID=2058762 RepID=UPI003B52E49A
MPSYNELGILFGLACTAVVLSVRKKIKHPHHKSLWKSALLLFSLYTLMLIITEVRWYFIKEQLQAFDLNQNGFIDLEEYTDEAIEALNKRTKDTARNYAFLIAAVISAVVSLTFYTTDVLRAHRKIKKSKNSTIHE